MKIIKYIILISIAVLCTNTNGYSQEFTYEWVDGNTYQIGVDKDWHPSAIKVDRSLADIKTDIEDINEIYLIGDIRLKNLDIDLRFDKSQYYFIPFNPEFGIVDLNMVNNKNEIQTDSRRDKDFIYLCSCDGDHGAPTPGDCVSAMSPAGRISCESTGCSTCMGEAILQGLVIPGGGIIIESSLRIVHNVFLEN